MAQEDKVKYIDAEKLIALIDTKLEDLGMSGSVWVGRSVLQELKNDIITSLQQEQSEVDLQKFTEKIKTFQGRHKHPEITSIKGAMAFMARMFYQYPNVAREWYESLPKATMD